MTLRTYEAVSDELMYVRTPKCAGLTMEKTFLGLYKNTCIKVSPANVIALNDIVTTFAVARNPWDRLVSLFEYYQKNYDTYKDMDFEDWFFRNDLKFPTFLADRCYIQYMDFYLKFEDLENEVNDKISKYEERIHLSHYNKTERRFSSLKDYFTTQEMIDTVADLNKYVINAIGYDF